MNGFEVEKIYEGVYKLKNEQVGPKVVNYNNIFLYRFMDFLYVENKALDTLAPSVVSSICRARARFSQTNYNANKEVRILFTNFINHKSPEKVFEIGAGKRPLIPSSIKNIEYVLSDADHEVVEELNASHKYLDFSSDNYSLPYTDGYFNIVVAVFVLHFYFYEKQIKEVHRCLAKNGVFLANVYRRTEESRDKLLASFKEAGFHVERLKDPNELCGYHEYWMIGKDAKTVKRDIEIFASLID